MIRVTVTLISAIHPSRNQVLGVMDIANDGKSHNARTGHYDGTLYRKPDFRAVTRTGRLENWPRLSKTIWHMVARMLDQMGYMK